MILDVIADYILDNGWLPEPVIIAIGVIFLVSPIIMTWVKQGNKMPFPYTGIREIKRWSTIIFVPFFLLILFIVGISISPIVDQIQSNDWVKTDATVDFAEERQDTCSNTEEGDCLITYWTHVEYIYEFDENTYSGNRHTFLSEMNSGHADEYPTGMIFSVFVDPHEPNESLMIKGWSGVWIEVLAVLLIFVLLVILFSASTIMFKIGYLLQSSANKQKAIDARTDWTLYKQLMESFQKRPRIRNTMLSFSFLAFNRAPRIWIIVGPTIFLILIISDMGGILSDLCCALACLILPLFALFTARSFEKTLPEHSHKRYKLVYDAAKPHPGAPSGQAQGGWDSDPEAIELQAMARSAWIKKNSNSLNMDEALLTSMILDSQVQLDGGSRILNVRFDGQDGTIEVKNMNEILENLGEIDDIAIIYLEDSKKMGRHLEFRSDDSGDDWYFHIREFLGEELILEESINMDQNYSAMIEIISNALKSSETEDGEWWN
jgi:hypothetical protein|tara:strand:- start:4697 stop:6169 length:1473 start_codon:yes stop_codon:yes gene_type:complete